MMASSTLLILSDFTLCFCQVYTNLGKVLFLDRGASIRFQGIKEERLHIFGSSALLVGGFQVKPAWLLQSELFKGDIPAGEAVSRMGGGLYR